MSISYWEDGDSMINADANMEKSVSGGGGQDLEQTSTSDVPHNDRMMLTGLQQ